MIITICFVGLWLFHLVTCQIETQQEAVDVACRIVRDGLSGDDAWCAIARSRFMLVTNGLKQTITIADINQICGPNSCAALVDLLMTRCIGAEDRVAIMVSKVYISKHIATM